MNLGSWTFFILFKIVLLLAALPDASFGLTDFLPRIARIDHTENSRFGGVRQQFLFWLQCEHTRVCIFQTESLHSLVHPYFLSWAQWLWEKSLLLICRSTLKIAITNLSLSLGFGFLLCLASLPMIFACQHSLRFCSSNVWWVLCVLALASSRFLGSQHGQDGSCPVLPWKRCVLPTMAQSMGKTTSLPPTPPPPPQSRIHLSPSPWLALFWPKHWPLDVNHKRGHCDSGRLLTSFPSIPSLSTPRLSSSSLLSFDDPVYERKLSVMSKYIGPIQFISRCARVGLLCLVFNCRLWSLSLEAWSCVSTKYGVHDPELAGFVSRVLIVINHRLWKSCIPRCLLPLQQMKKISPIMYLRTWLAPCNPYEVLRRCTFHLPTGVTSFSPFNLAPD